MVRPAKDPYAIPKARIHSACRKLWLWSPNRKAALTTARISRGLYVCAECKALTTAKEIAVDHKERVGSVLEAGYLERLFCHPSQLQVLCTACHDRKTAKERKS
jgi:5-methylcytosine-specific restriction endonuclease McrA